MGRKMSLFPNLCYSARIPRVEHLALNTAWQWLSRLALARVLLFASSSTGSPKTAPKSGNDRAAAVRGTVTAVQGDSALPGATVKLSRTLPESVPLTLETDENGHYEFLDLAPGAYTISVNAKGFKAKTTSVTLNRADQKSQNFSLELEVISERVEVSASVSLMVTESASAPAAFITTTELITLPTAQERVKEVLPVTPGVVQTLDSKLVFKGSDENQSLLIVNSARNTDPVTGSFGITVPTDAVESFAVYKTPYDSSLGSFSGGLTTIETRPPDDQYSFKLRGIVPSVLGKNGSMVGIAEAIPGVSFDAPLIPHKLLLSESFQYEMKKSTIEGLPWPFDISKRQGFNSFSTLEFILAPNHVLTLTVNAFPLRQQHVDISALVPLGASNDLDQSGVAIGLNDKYQFSSGAILSVVSQYMRFDSNAHGQGPLDMLITPQGYGGNYFNQWSRRGKEFQAGPSFQFPQGHWYGEHEIRVGADIDYRSFLGTTLSHPIQLLRADNSLAQQITFGVAPAQS